jgi:hypothetical protein
LFFCFGIAVELTNLKMQLQREADVTRTAKEKEVKTASDNAIAEVQAQCAKDLEAAKDASAKARADVLEIVHSTGQPQGGPAVKEAEKSQRESEAAAALIETQHQMEQLKVECVNECALAELASQLEVEKACHMAERSQAEAKAVRCASEAAAARHTMELELVNLKDTVQRSEATVRAAALAVEIATLSDSLKTTKADLKASNAHLQTVNEAVDKATQKACHMAERSRAEAEAVRCASKAAAAQHTLELDARLKAVNDAAENGLYRLKGHHDMLQEIILCFSVVIMASVVACAAPWILPYLEISMDAELMAMALRGTKTFCCVVLGYRGLDKGYATELWNCIGKYWGVIKAAFALLFSVLNMLFVSGLIGRLLNGGFWGVGLALLLVGMVLYVFSSLYSMVTDNLLLVFMWGYSEKVLADAKEDFEACKKACEACKATTVLSPPVNKVQEKQQQQQQQKKKKKKK